MSKYTEGPWGINGHKNLIFADGKRDQLPIAVISTGVIQGAYESSLIRANANLISQAPAMHKELKKILTGFIDYPAIQKILDKVEGEV
jgi:hypothetical protein